MAELSSVIQPLAKLIKTPKEKCSLVASEQLCDLAGVGPSLGSDALVSHSLLN